MSDKPSGSGPIPDDTLDTARETGKGNVRSAVADELRDATTHAGARDSASSAGRGVRSGMSDLGDDETGAGKGILGGVGPTSVVVLIVIAIVIYLLLR